MSECTDRHWCRIVVDDNGGCWLWTGCTDKHGYGKVSGSSYGTTLAHRLFYGDLVAPIPEGMVIDHLCRVRRCVNPAHMEVVTPLENTLRSPILGCGLPKWGLLTHCLRGHEFTPENTYLRPDRLGRCCRTCKRENAARWTAQSHRDHIREVAERALIHEGWREMHGEDAA